MDGLVGQPGIETTLNVPTHGYHCAMASPDRSRKIALDGTVNFRDLGGYGTSDGRHTKWGRIYRADGLTHLSETDLDLLRELGIKTVIDLRTSAEVDEGTFPIDKLAVSFHHHPLMRQVGSNDDFTVTPGFLAATYLDMADESHGAIAKVLRLLANDANAPAVFHCTAGKDRTGVTAAVLLSLLGCSRATVVADYVESHAAMDALRERLAEKYPAAKDTIMAADDLFSADAASIELFLDHLEQRHGSVEGFAHFAGLTSDDIDQLQHNLLEA